MLRWVKELFAKGSKVTLCRPCSDGLYNDNWVGLDDAQIEARKRAVDDARIVMRDAPITSGRHTCVVCTDSFSTGDLWDAGRLEGFGSLIA